ncbi:Hypothetical protein D9617_25g061100 [Elsinoe fawcettii]|nr:Hypothetical protein D9617_25g061100 [Elsinoe fawcettii]
MDDPMDTSPSATALVLSTPELLELILSHLPPIHLLLTQRTSTFFHHLITTSPLLQQLLFLRPNWSLQGHYASTKPGPRPLNNLMLRHITPSLYPTMTLRSLSFTSPTALLAAQESLSLPSCPLPSPPEKETGFWAWSINVSLPSTSFLDSCPEAVRYEHASWRRMLLSQPPPTELHLCRRWRRAEAPAVVVGEGVRMEDLVGAAREGKGEGKWREFVSSDSDWHLEGAVRYSSFVEGGR